jgi:peptide deformylase
MSEVLKFDTTTGFVAEDNKPYTVLHESFSGLRKTMPEFDVSVLPNNKMNNVITNLKMTMKLYGAIGIAANQVGILERFFLIGTDQFQMACINPKVLESSEEIVKDTEGCLSFPAFFLSIPRPKWIEVEFTDENGQRKQTRLDGLTARCFLHELEHLNGVKFTSHVGSVAMLQAKRKQEKLIKKIVRRKK